MKVYVALYVTPMDNLDRCSPGEPHSLGVYLARESAQRRVDEVEGWHEDFLARADEVRNEARRRIREWATHVLGASRDEHCRNSLRLRFDSIDTYDCHINSLSQYGLNLSASVIEQFVRGHVLDDFSLPPLDFPPPPSWDHPIELSGFEDYHVLECEMEEATP